MVYLSLPLPLVSFSCCRTEQAQQAKQDQQQQGGANARPAANSLLCPCQYSTQALLGQKTDQHKQPTQATSLVRLSTCYARANRSLDVADSPTQASYRRKADTHEDNEADLVGV